MSQRGSRKNMENNSMLFDFSRLLGKLKNFAANAEQLKILNVVYFSRDFCAKTAKKITKRYNIAFFASKKF
jgi:hypothetical protein